MAWSGQVFAHNWQCMIRAVLPITRRRPKAPAGGGKPVCSDGAREMRLLRSGRRSASSLLLLGQRNSHRVVSEFLFLPTMAPGWAGNLCRHQSPGRHCPGVLPLARRLRPLAGIAFQRQWKRQAFALGGGDYWAPGQLVGDFLRNRPSKHFGDVQPRGSNSAPSTWASRRVS